MITFSTTSKNVKSHILLVGGLRPAENIGRNVLVRFARHLAKG